MRTSNQSHFATVPSADIQRSVFQRDQTIKMTFNCGELIPFYVDEVLPGDTFDISTAFVARTTTPLTPVMDELEIEFFFFFVPCRLVWDNWQELHGENKNGAWYPSTPPALVPALNFPVNTLSAIKCHSIGDYMGLPITSDWTAEQMASFDNVINCLPFRAYGLIWNEWFRDQNLQAPIPIQKTSTNDAIAYKYHAVQFPLKVNKKHDYFTSCLPSPQKGQSVYLPLADGNIPVLTGDEHVTSGILPRPPLKLMSNSSFSVPSNRAVGIGSGELRSAVSPSVSYDSSDSGLMPSNLWADLSEVTAATVAQLRQAFQLQRLFERDARGGTRYTEILRSHFGVTSPDARLQRPEYLGGSKERLNMQQVVQTSSTDTTSPQGNTTAYSLTSGNVGGIHQSFTEHGYVLGLLTVRNRKTYNQGVERMWFKRDRFDFYYPALAHISEQPVYTREIYATSSTMNSGQVFGYQEAWSEYRFKPNRVAGDMRTTSPQTLSSWHYADHYTSTPTLSSAFITDNTRENVDRTLSLSSSVAPQLIGDFLVMNKAVRPLPVYSVPGLIDHF